MKKKEKQCQNRNQHITMHQRVKFQSMWITSDFGT